jgi:hypothetical protein
MLQVLEDDGYERTKPQESIAVDLLSQLPETGVQRLFKKLYSARTESVVGGEGISWFEMQLGSHYPVISCLCSNASKCYSKLTKVGIVRKRGICMTDSQVGVYVL